MRGYSAMKSPSKSRGVGLAYGNFLQIMGESHIINLGDVMVLDLLFSAGLVAVLWGVEPQEDPSRAEPGSR